MSPLATAAVQSAQQAPATHAMSQPAQTSNMQPQATPQHHQLLMKQQQAAALLTPQNNQQVGKKDLTLNFSSDFYDNQMV